MAGGIVVSVVVPSHARAPRLRWLLNALEHQTFVEPWEVIVVHDYDTVTAGRVIERHPLAVSGTLRAIPIPAGTGSPARQRNLGWRAARGELIAFTDDDCRPESDWLERLVAASRGSHCGIVQGRTRPEPFEHEILRAPHVRTLDIHPVGPYAQTCNILYPCELLVRLGGFDERAITGEDVDISLRAKEAGCMIDPAPAAVVNHAVESHTLPGILRQNLKWRHLAYLVKRHPGFRRDLPLGVFWDADHLRVCLAAAGGLAARRSPAAALLALPFLRRQLRRRGTARRGRALALVELPGQAVRQLAEVGVLTVASVRERTLVL